MAKEILALEIIEEGLTLDESTEGVSCCWTIYTFYGYM